MSNNRQRCRGATTSETSANWVRRYDERRYRDCSRERDGTGCRTIRRIQWIFACGVSGITLLYSHGASRYIARFLVNTGCAYIETTIPRDEAVGARRVAAAVAPETYTPCRQVGKFVVQLSLVYQQVKTLGGRLSARFTSLSGKLV